MIKRLLCALTFVAASAVALADPIGGNGSYPGSGSGGGGAVYPAPASSPFPSGCQYNATPPTVANGATVEQQCDINGKTLFNGIITAPSPLPVTAAPFARTYAGSTITAGGTAQTLFAAGVIAHGCDIQNTSAGGEYLRFDGNNASATSLYLAPGGGYYECPITGLPTTLVSIFGATTGQTFAAEYW
jgi:hypothetical protein